METLFFAKLKEFQNLMIFEIGLIYGNSLFCETKRIPEFDDFWNCKIWEIFAIFEIINF